MASRAGGQPDSGDSDALSEPASTPDPEGSEPPEASSTEGGRTLAQKVDHLFKTVHPASGEFTYAHVSQATQADGGPGISVATLWALRAGTRDNPTMRNLQALAKFFGVPAQYFFDDEVSERVDEQLALVTALRDAPVRAMAMRVSGLSHESLANITAIVDSVRRLEGLPDEAMPYIAGSDEDAGRSSTS